MTTFTARHIGVDSLRIVKKSKTHFEVQRKNTRHVFMPLVSYSFIQPIPIPPWDFWEVESVHKTIASARKQIKHLLSLDSEGEVVQ
jgi:hypothetical protein